MRRPPQPVSSAPREPAAFGRPEVRGRAGCTSGDSAPLGAPAGHPGPGGRRQETGHAYAAAAATAKIGSGTSDLMPPVGSRARSGTSTDGTLLPL